MNSLLGVGTGVASIYMAEGKFTSAMKVMGEAVTGFAAAATAAMARFLAFYAAIQIAGEAFRQFNDKTGLYKEEASLINQLNSAKYANQYSQAYGYGDRSENIAEIENKLAEVRQKIKTKEEAEETAHTNKYLDRAKKMADAAQASAQLGSHLIGGGTGQLSNPNTKGGTGARYAPDNSQQINRQIMGYEVNNSLSEAKQAANAYEEALNRIEVKERIFGVTTETSSKKIELMNQRVLALVASSLEWSSVANEYEQKANDMVEGNRELRAKLGELKLSWSKLNKDEKAEFIENNKQYVQDEKTLLKLLQLADKLREATSQAKKDASNIASNSVTTGLNDAATIYQDKFHRLDLGREHGIYELGRYYTDEQKRAIELATAKNQLKEAQKELNRIEAEYGKDSTKWLEQRNNVDKLKKSVDDLSNAYKAAQDSVAEMVADTISTGGSLSNVWKRLWEEFTRDALLSLFRVKHETSTLGMLLGGLFGIKTSHSGENIKRMHSGGTVGDELKDDEVLRVLQVGERVLSKDQNRVFTNMMAGFKSSKVEIVPYLKNPELAKGNISVEMKQNEAHLAKLDLQNELLAQQNKMIMQMAQNGGNGGNVIVMPVAPSAEQVLKIIEANPDALFNVINKGRLLGYR